MDYLAIVRCVTRANMMFENAVKAKPCRDLIGSPAWQLCRTYLAEREAALVDAKRMDEEQEEGRALMLLFILAALRLEDREPIEALRLMGTHRVDARKPKAKERYAIAGRNRPRPIIKWRNYTRARRGVTPHLDRVEQSLASSLNELARWSNPAICQDAIDRFGEEAITYLGGLR